jgi:lipopolysaccharide transport system permease protein
VPSSALEPIPAVTSPAQSSLHRGWADIAAALRRNDLALTFGWHDVTQRYRRSRVGAFWLTINMGVLIGTIGLVFGTLFRTPMNEFLPYVTIGLVIWGFLQTTINEGCEGFVASEGIILQVRMPLFTHLLRVLYRNLGILGHNVLILPIVFLTFLRPVGWSALLAIPGLALLVLNAAWIILVLAVVCARFRDMTQVMQNVMQVFFYFTPIIWNAETLPARVGSTLVLVNPLFHLLTVVRAPLLGATVGLESWAVAVGMAVVGWAFALPFYGRYRQRVPYWL